MKGSQSQRNHRTKIRVYRTMCEPVLEIDILSRKSCLTKVEYLQVRHPSVWWWWWWGWMLCFAKTLKSSQKKPISRVSSLT